MSKINKSLQLLYTAHRRIKTTCRSMLWRLQRASSLITYRPYFTSPTAASPPTSQLPHFSYSLTFRVLIQNLAELFFLMSLLKRRWNSPLAVTPHFYIQTSPETDHRAILSPKTSTPQILKIFKNLKIKLKLYKNFLDA